MAVSLRAQDQTRADKRASGLPTTGGHPEDPAESVRSYIRGSQKLFTFQANWRHL